MFNFKLKAKTDKQTYDISDVFSSLTIHQKLFYLPIVQIEFSPSTSTKKDEQDYGIIKQIDISITHTEQKRLILNSTFIPVTYNVQLDQTLFDQFQENTIVCTDQITTDTLKTFVGGVFEKIKPEDLLKKLLSANKGLKIQNEAFDLKTEFEQIFIPYTSLFDALQYLLVNFNVYNNTPFFTIFYDLEKEGQLTLKISTFQKELSKAAQMKFFFGPSSIKPDDYTLLKTLTEIHSQIAPQKIIPEKIILNTLSNDEFFKTETITIDTIAQKTGLNIEKDKIKHLLAEPIQCIATSPTVQQTYQLVMSYILQSLTTLEMSFSAQVNDIKHLKPGTIIEIKCGLDRQKCLNGKYIINDITITFKNRSQFADINLKVSRAWI